MALSRQSPAFSLLEMLVVVAIIAVLIAILLPSIGKARVKAQSTACASNLRQIVTAYRMYVESENAGRNIYQPAAAGAPAGSLWMYSLEPYLASDAKPYVCPTANTANPAGPYGTHLAAWDGTNYNSLQLKAIATAKVGKSGELLGVDNHPITATSKGYTASYGFNSWLNTRNRLPPNSAAGAITLKVFNAMKSPTTTPVFSDATWCTTNGSNPRYGADCEGVDPQDLSSVTDLLGSNTANSTARVALNRHDMSINVGFADASAGKVAISDLYKVTWYEGWSPRSFPMPLTTTMPANK